MNNQPIDYQSDETRLTGGLSKIVTTYTKAVISMCSGNKPDVSDDAKRLKDEILAWHETEKQKYAMAYADNHLITVQTIIEYEEWFNDYKEYLSKAENCNLSINNDKISSFRGIPIKGQKYHMSTVGYNVGLSLPDFDGLYNYLKYKINYNEKDNSNE